MDERRIATVLMLDVVDSTRVASELGDARYRELAARFNGLVRASLKRFGGKEEDHAGDGFFATFTQPDRAIRSAAALAEEVRTLGIEIRSGIHTGQTDDQAGKAHGIAVVIGSRVMSLAGAGEILVTSTTKELATGSGFGFEDFSVHDLKGVPGTWQVFAVTEVDGTQRPRTLPAAEAAERRAAIEPTVRRGRPRRAALIAGGLAGLITIVAVAYTVTREEPDPSAKASDEPAPLSEVVVQVDPEKDPPVVESIPVPVPRVFVPGAILPRGPHSMVVGQGGVWTVRFRSLFHVDPSRSEVRSRIELDTGGQSFSVNLAEGSDKIWVAYDRGLIEVNPATDAQREVMDLRTVGAPGSVDIVAGGGFVWVGTGDGRLVRYDPRTEEDRTRTDLDAIDAMAYGHGSVWTTDLVGGTVSRYDPDTMRRLAEVDVVADYLVSGDLSVWTLSTSAGTLARIEPTTNEVLGVVQVGSDPFGLAAGAGAVWVGDEDGMIRRVGEETRAVTEVLLGAPVRTLAFDDETSTIWVDVA